MSTPTKKSTFVPTHIFVLHSGVRVPVQAKADGDAWMAWEEDGKCWATTVSNVSSVWWVCLERNVSNIAHVEVAVLA